MIRRTHQILALLGGFVLLLGACAEKSPEEKIAELRSKYTAEVNQSGFVAKPRMPEPVAEEIVDEDETGDAADTAEGEAASEDDELFEPPDLGPLRYDILLDILVATGSRDRLPQLTIDVVHLDPDEKELHRWPVTLDTSQILQGPGVQITHSLEDLEYSEGDIFFTEVRPGITPAEYDQYPEFKAGG